MRAVLEPRIYVIGLSLELYHEVFRDFDAILAGQLKKYGESLSKISVVKQVEICRDLNQVENGFKKAESLGVDCVVLIPMCYTTSLNALDPVLRTDIPIVVWNTQEAETFDENYDFDILLRNHTAQGAQDLTNVLLRNGKPFGLECGHYEDDRVLSKLGGWFKAARAFRAARDCRVGRLGHPFPGMGDFAFDESAMAADWGPSVIDLDFARLAELVSEVDEKSSDAILRRDKEIFLIDPKVTKEIHQLSVKLELALRRLVNENSLDALTMNFLDLMDDGGIATIPFLGINKLIAEGLGYAGEGDVVTAAAMAELRQLAGVANFTEMFTIDYQQNHLLMTHMQECNPALARRDSKIKLARKDFWANGVEPYVGMWFTLEPGDVTLLCVTSDESGDFKFIVKEAEILDRPPFEKLDIPHWTLALMDVGVEDFLTSYGRAGGSHHLCAAPGKLADNLEKLAKLHKFEYIRL